MSYEDFLASKALQTVAAGMEKAPRLSKHLFPFQRDDITWRVRPSGVVVMNPPYALAMEFVQRALAECERVAALLRLPWLASQKRSTWLRANTPSVHVLPKRPSFTGKGCDATDYAWMLWGFGSPRVHILDVSDPTPSGANQQAQAAPRTP